LEEKRSKILLLAINFINLIYLLIAWHLHAWVPPGFPLGKGGQKTYIQTALDFLTDFSGVFKADE
jgi:hypothetical protein